MICKKCGKVIEEGRNWGDKKNPICPLCGRTMNEKAWERLSDENNDTCVSCGEIIPEGRQICKKCETFYNA